MKRHNVKRHYDSKHKKGFDSVGKGERLKEFKKRFDAYVGEAKRVSVCAQGASHLNEASYRICLSLTRHQVQKQTKCFSWLVPKLCLRVF